MAFLNATGITRLVTDLKNRFAALAHTHAAATDITGQLPVSNGGTGASTASGARTNLDAAQDDSSGVTLAETATSLATTIARAGTGASDWGANEASLRSQIQTLQDSVSWKYAGTRTGTASLTVPGHNELLVIIEFGGNSNYGYSLVVPAIHTIGPSRFILGGGVPNDTHMTVVSVTRSDNVTSVALMSDKYNNSDYINNAKIYVYYH